VQIRLSPSKMKELMKRQCQGNYNRFSRELGVDPAHLHRFLNTGVGGGKKLIFSLMDYCERNNLNYKNYLDL
jgi:Fe-S cluster assembly ATPase SufC